MASMHSVCGWSIGQAITDISQLQEGLLVRSGIEYDGVLERLDQANPKSKPKCTQTQMKKQKHKQKQIQMYYLSQN